MMHHGGGGEKLSSHLPDVLGLGIESGIVDLRESR